MMQPVGWLSTVAEPAREYVIPHASSPSITRFCATAKGGKTAISGTYYVHDGGRWAKRQVLYTLRSRIALNNRTKEGQVPAGSENGGAGDASDAGRTWIAREGMREDVMVQ